ncbi:MAG: hypothetical protein U0900_08385 [Myxococcota bacterium]
MSRPRSNEAPARATLWPIEAGEPWSGLQVEKLEVLSRGDFVTGLRIRRPAGAEAANAARPGLLLLIHDATGHASAATWSPIAGWLARGGRTEAIALDLPLHGPRSSAKLSERLVAGFAALARGAFLDRNGTVLVEEFLRQSTHDLGRSLDARLALGEIDPDRVALIGVGLGARVADAWLAEDDRVRAAVLVRTGRAPALPLAAAPERLELESGDAPDWAFEAERFLRSRIAL